MWTGYAGPGWARLIKELDKKLKQVETDVLDAFKELEGE
jgi:hypothetical protein